MTCMRLFALALLSLPAFSFGRIGFEFELPFDGELKYSGDASILPAQYKFEPRAGVKFGKYFQLGLLMLKAVEQADGWNIFPDPGPSDTSGGLINMLYKKTDRRTGIGAYLQINLPNLKMGAFAYPFFGTEYVGQGIESDLRIYDGKTFRKSNAPNSNAVLQHSRVTTYAGCKGEFNEHFGIYGALTENNHWQNLIGSHKGAWATLGFRWGLILSL